MRRRLLISSLPLALMLGPLASTWGEETNRSQLLARIDAIVEEAMERDQVVGTSIGARKKGEVLVAKGYGYADLENNVRATEHTVYRLGSITKQFTAVAIMMLVEQGKLSLDEDLKKFLPDYPTKGHRITVDRLLNHTSGIKGYTEMGERFWGVSRLDLSHEDMIDMISAEPFEFPPGKKYQYNNSAYYLLGVIIESISGESYTDFLHENMWQPLGMLETRYLDNAPIVKNRAEGYEVRDGQVVNDDPLSMRLPYSGGALGSSVVDLFKWQTALVENRLIGGESHRRMTTAGTLNDGSKTTYGYGLALGNLEGHRKVAHGGGINGFRTQLSYYPDDDLTVVVLCNSGSAHPAVLESRIARTVLGVPERTVEEVALSSEELEIYTGTYHPGRAPMEVSIEDGVLVVTGLRLRPLGNHVFVPTVDKYNIFTFTVADGKAVSLRMKREGHVTEAPRVQ